MHPHLLLFYSQPFWKSFIAHLTAWQAVGVSSKSKPLGEFLAAFACTMYYVKESPLTSDLVFICYVTAIVMLLLRVSQRQERIMLSLSLDLLAIS